MKGEVDILSPESESFGQTADILVLIDTNVIRISMSTHFLTLAIKEF